MYHLGKRSKKRLEGVHPDLVKVVEEAIKITPVDFTVLEGVRSIERQRQLVKRGVSKTMHSRHITGHAVDIAPWVKGTVSWDWEYYYCLADAMKKSAKELGVPIRWGGAWHLSPLYKWDGDAKSASQDYIRERTAQGRRAFVDGPHFELPREYYDD